MPMSVSRSSRCLLRQSRQWSSLPVPASRRCIHQTSKLRKPDDDKPTGPQNSKSTNVPATRQSRDVGSSTSGSDIPLTREAAAKYFPPYTAEEMEFLRRKYTPEQMKAIEAGESAIDPLDLLKQGVVRNDPMALEYLDDFRNIHPVLDKKRVAPDSDYDTKLRFKTDDEMDEDLADFWEQQAQKGTENENFELDFEKFMDNYRFMVGKDGEDQRVTPDFIAPKLNKLTDPNAKRAIPHEEDESGSSNKEFWDRLSVQTGLSVQYMKSLRSKTLVFNSVSNQTRMGKIRSMFVMAVCGNEAGLLGIGSGKSANGGSAERQALGNAIRSMVPIPRYEGRTIYGDATGKVGATVVNLYNRPPGFGIRCQEKIYYMCKCAGITDLAARMPRSTNPMNTVKATFEALTNQRLPEVVARGRGKKMIDVRKVYYAGMN